QRGNLHAPVENAQIIPLTNESFDDFDQRALTKVISARLETKAQYADTLLPLTYNLIQAPANLRLIAREDGVENRRFEVVRFSLICKSPQILWQARAAKGKTRHEIRARNIQLSILAENVHDFMGIHTKDLAEIADLIGEANLQRVPTVVDVLDHLGH